MSPWTYVPWTCVPWAGVGARISPHLAMATLLFADLVPSRRAACLGLGRSDIGGDKGMVVGRRMREELSQKLSRESESDSCTRDDKVRERERFLAIPNKSNTHASFGAWSPVHARARRADRVDKVRNA